jgi:uncharacterized protein
MTINTIIGQVARGKDYFPRPDITDEIIGKLAAGGNVLLVAPRRVGKSSIMFNLLDNPPSKFIIIYYISESVNDANEFYRKLLHHIWEKIYGIKKYKSVWGTWAKEFSHYIDGISTDGVKFRQSSSIDYYEELRKLLKSLSLGEKIIVLIDEFSSTVENIMTDTDQKAAIHFLESKRVLRQDPDIQGKISFVYAGSIGLENIVGRMNSINRINDLVPVYIKPLNKKEANKLTGKILMGSEITLADEAIDHLCSIVEWLIPYYFQVILDESYKLVTAANTTVITREIIDASVNNALKKRIYFEHWFERLRKAYQGNDFRFIKDILNLISVQKTISSSEIIDLAYKYGLNDSRADLINSLKHDGYINNNDDPRVYRFNSPLLREWWNANVAN